MNTLLNEAKKYKDLNEYAEKNQIVVFGDRYLANFPFYDLMQGKITDYAVYNRSLNLLTLKDAANVVEYCLYHLSPNSVLLHFENATQDETFRENYYSLIEKIRSVNKKCRIGLLERTPQTGRAIESIARITKCEYIPVPEDADEKFVFRKMDAFFRAGRISFGDAFSI